MPTEPSTSFQCRTLPSGRKVYRFSALEGVAHVVHAYTTRHGELFPPEADVGAVLYRRLAREVGCRDVAWCRQVHGNVVLPVRQHGCAGEADGLVTDQPGLAVLGRSADCPLILAAEKHGRAVGMAHASWRATIKRIAVSLIETMQREFGADPADVIACIGPSVGPDRYEVGRDVYDAAIEHLGPKAKAFFIAVPPTSPAGEPKWLLDLWAANTSQLLQAGVGFRNLYTARICTIQRNDLFPSVRVEGASVGRFAGVIGLEGE